MDTSNTIFVGVKGQVLALRRDDGSELWRTRLKDAVLSVGDRFVTLLVDGGHVYAHTYGALTCLDAATGEKLWTNRLEGLGYDITSLAVAGATAPSQSALTHHWRTKEVGDASSASGAV